MNTFYYINLTLLFILPFFLYFAVCSRLVLHPVMISMISGVYLFLVGTQMALVNDTGLSGKFLYIIIGVFAGCFIGRGGRKAKTNYVIEINSKNAAAHLVPYKALVLLSLLFVALLFLVKGVPLFADEPNIAKVTITSGGGWILTRFIRYFLLIMFYVSIVYCFNQARGRLNLQRKKQGKFNIFDVIRYGGKGWIFMGVAILMFFAFLGYKANVIAFFLWTACFTGLLIGIRPRHIVLFIISGAVSSIIILAVLEKSGALQELVSALLARATMSAAGGFIYVLNNYGANESFMYGEGFWYDFSNMLLRLGLQPQIPVQLHELNFDAFIFEKIIGHNEYKMQAATSFFGQLYANFGLPVTVLGTFLFFFVYVKFGNFLVTHKKTLIGTPVFFFVFQQFQTFVGGGPVIITVFDTVLSLIMFYTVYIVIYLFFYLPTGRLSFKIP